LRKRVDGFIIVTAGGENKHIKSLIQRKIPVVLLDRRIDGLKLDAALVDNEGGAAKLLLEQMRGRRKKPKEIVLEVELKKRQFIFEERG